MITNKMYLDFEIDKLSHSIENVQTGKSYETEVLPLLKSDMKQILKKNGWQFDWAMEVKNPAKSVFKLVTLQQPEVIQGLVSISKEDGYVLMNLIESSPVNFGKNKIHYGDIGCRAYWWTSYDNLRTRSSTINSKIFPKL